MIKVKVTETASGKNHSFTESFRSIGRAKEYADFVNRGENLKAEIVK